MTLDSVGAIVGFLLLIAPGAIWELERSKFLPGVKESALIELARVALVSLLSTTVAVALTLPLIWWPFYLEAQAAEVDPLQSSVSAVPYVGAAFLTAAIACLLVYLTSLVRWPTRGSIQGMRLWHRYFVAKRPPKSGDPVVTVELVEGTIWKGALTGFDSDPEDSQRWLSIAQPMKRRKNSSQKFEAVSASTESVLLPEGQIKSIQIAYPFAVEPGTDEQAKEEFRSILGDVRTLVPRIVAWAGRRQGI